MPPPSRASQPRIVVIGAGIVGVSAALFLARRGFQVTCIEADAQFSTPAPRPRAASLAAAGMLGALSEVMHEGAGHHRRMTELGALGLKAWRTLSTSDTALSRSLRFSGALLLAHDDGDAPRVRRVSDRARAIGVRADGAEGLPADLDPVLFGARVRYSVRLPDEGFVEVEETLLRLCALALEAGASFLRARAVAELVVGEHVEAVRLDDGGLIPCDAVVIATGALASAPLAAVAPALGRITPAKGILGETVAPKGLQSPDLIRTPRVYLVRRGDKIRFGSTSEVGRTDLDDDPEALAALYLEMRRVLPGAKFPPRAQQISAGLRPMSPDGGPMVGRNGPPGCFVAIGHGRNGWLLGPATGEAIAAELAGEEISALWTAFRPDRFG